MARDPYQYFRIEARELLDQLSKGALELEKNTVAPDRIALMLRLAHTLKGAARVVKQHEIADQAHTIEDVLAPFRDGADAVSRDCIDAMLKALDGIGLQLAALDPRASHEHPTDTGAPVPTPLVVAGDFTQPVRADFDEMDVLLEGLSETSAQLAALRSGVAALQRNSRIARLLEEHWSAPRSDRSGTLTPKLGSMIGELRSAAESAYREFNGGIEQMDRELTQVREAAEHLRLLPARLMFVSLERVVRDESNNAGKRVAFTTRGGEVRLDAQVFNVVQSALVQTVRNAVAHGIEAVADREAAGKSAEGRIAVEVRQRGHQAVFICQDDGRGIDIEAVRRGVQRKGMPVTEAEKLGTEELLQMLLRGGISTSSAVTQLAGRGIGLDVVREAAAQLRGNVSIRTQKKQGTAVEILVPVSLAAIDALIVETADRTVSIPLHAVKRTMRVAAEDLTLSARGASITFEGKVIPFVSLTDVLRRNIQMAANVKSYSAIVIEGANALAALSVDRLRGTQNLVLRRLPHFTPSDPIVAGASLDAEGHPQLVLDPVELVEHVYHTLPVLAVSSSLRDPILVIDDSLTTRMLEQSILESAGYEVHLAVSAEDGLERARKRRYVLFLVDVEMPGMDGFAFVERVREDALLRDIPAVLVTSRAAPEDFERGEKVGAQGYIVKGRFDQTEFLEKIRSLVGM